MQKSDTVDICEDCGVPEDRHSYNGDVPCKRCTVESMWYDMVEHYCGECIEYIVDHYERRNEYTCAHGYTR